MDACGLLVLGVGVLFLPGILENQYPSTFQYKGTLYRHRVTVQNACQFWHRLPAGKVERFRACEWEVPRSVVCLFPEIIYDVWVPVQLGEAQRRISLEIKRVNVGATPHQRPATEEASHGRGDM